MQDLAKMIKKFVKKSKKILSAAVFKMCGIYTAADKEA